MKELQLRKKEEGIKEQNSGYTLLQLAEKYLNDDKYKKRSPTTVQGYKNLLNNWILPALGDYKIRNIEESDLENLYDKMRKSKNPKTGEFLSSTYVTHAHKLIKSMYNYAKKKKWTLSNPTDYVINIPKYNSPERDYYTYEEMINVFELLKSYDLRFRCAIYLLFNTGIRRGELAGLKWQDLKIKTIPKIVDGQRVVQKRFYLSVNKEIVRVTDENIKDEDIIEKLGKGLVCKKLKTDKSKRELSVIMEAYDLLMEYRQEQIARGFTPRDDDYIFRTEKLDRVYDPNYLTEAWNKFLTINNLRKITIHDIRHSHATYLLSIGVPIQDVSRRLGHSESTTTLKTYTHSNLVQDEKITDYMEMILTNSNSNTKYLNAEIHELSVTDNILTVYSIITGLQLTDIENIYSVLDKAMGKRVDTDFLPIAVQATRDYLFDRYPELKDTAYLIENLSSSQLDAFINLVTDLSMGIYYDLDKVLNVEKANSNILL